MGDPDPYRLRGLGLLGAWLHVWTPPSYDCVAVTARFGRASDPGGRGIIGISFRLVVDFARGRFAWCRIVPLADPDRVTHPLPGACRPN
jgi:hypothetical protein